MDKNKALSAFAALSQPTRLEALRLLIRAGPSGLAAGEIGETLSVKQNTMSANLNVLTQSGLVRHARQGRSIRYFADYDAVRGLIGFLIRDCCGGRPEVCADILTEADCLC